MELGAKIKELSKQRGVSLNQVSERSGIDRRYLSKIVSGEVAEPGAFKARDIARAFGMSLDALLEGVDPPSRKKGATAAIR